MAILSISEASRRWHLGRSNLYRAVKSGRLNLSARPDGSRGIDTSELVRVFGEPSTGTTANIPPLSGESPPATDPDDREPARTPSPVNLLQAQVNQLTNQLEQAHKREARLLTMLETEQQSRRDLETKLLPAPTPANVLGWLQDLRLLVHPAPSGVLQPVAVLSLVDRQDRQRIGMGAADHVLRELIELWPDGVWLGRPMQMILADEHRVAGILEWVPPPAALTAAPSWLPVSSPAPAALSA